MVYLHVIVVEVAVVLIVAGLVDGWKVIRRGR